MTTHLSVIEVSDITSLRLRCPRCKNHYEIERGSKLPEGCSVMRVPYSEEEREVIASVRRGWQELERLEKGALGFVIED